MKGWTMFCDAFFGEHIADIDDAYITPWRKPETVTAAKQDASSGLFKIYAFNQDEDLEP
jgi:hypothetical protein